MQRNTDVTRIKVCGITNLDDARCAATAGADFLGFIFYPKSPRFVTPEQAAVITQAIRDEFGTGAPRCTGVFVDEPAARVIEILDTAGLDLAQLHGDEPPDVVQSLHPRAFKAIRPRTPAEANAAIATYRGAIAALQDRDVTLPQLLIDAYHPQQYGGTGISADLAVVRPIARQVRLLLAGGLTPETVASAIEQVRPWGVDVSSGVEATKGVKDHAKVRTFIQAVHQCNASNPPAATQFTDNTHKEQ
jgi:phosphoribosylanthranilate isomerase